MRLFSLIFFFITLQVTAAEKVLLLAGDSLSAGYGLTTAQSWPTLLQQELTQQKINWRIHNASVSGETSGGLLARLPALLSQVKPDAVLIEIGGNDGLRGYPPQTLQSNLNAMVAMVQKHQAKPLLMQIRIPPNYGPKYAELFTAVYPQVAAEKKIPLWPFFMDEIAINPTLMQADGIHPNAQAQSIIRDFMLTWVKQL